MAKNISIADMRWSIQHIIEAATKFIGAENKAELVDDIESFTHDARHRFGIAGRLHLDSQSFFHKVGRLLLLIYEEAGPTYINGVISISEEIGDTAKLAEANIIKIEADKARELGKEMHEPTIEEKIPGLEKACRMFLHEIENDPILQIDEALLRQNIKKELKSKLGFDGLDDEKIIEKMKEEVKRLKRKNN